MRELMWKCLGVSRAAPETKNKLGVVALLYFIQGAPAAILWEVLPVYFRLHGVSLRAIGGLRLLELPYSLKVFWSPLVHRYGDRRMWVLGCMLGIAAILFALPWVDVAGVGLLVLILVLAFTTLSATQDVAIDSYSVGLIAREEEGPANGVRASAYRVALVFVGGGLVFLAAALQWSVLFNLAGAVFVALGFVLALDSATSFGRNSAPALVARIYRLGRDLAGDSSGGVCFNLQARRVCHRSDGQTVLGGLRQSYLAGPRRSHVSDRIVSHDLRYRSQRNWSISRRRIHHALRNFPRRVVLGLAASRLEYGLLRRGMVGSRALWSLRRIDVRVV